MNSIFISYQHRESQKQELEIHLATLKSQGLISVWNDRRIDAGDEWEGKISSALESADIVILLVSPYFLNSEYCTDVELTRALQRHDEGTARVIPVILEHCDWKYAIFSHLQGLPKDGKPISTFPNPHEAYLQIVEGIRKILPAHQTTSNPAPPMYGSKSSESTIETQLRSSNLGLPREFTDKQKDDFLDQAYEYLIKFFRNSLEELEVRNPGYSGKVKELGGQRFTAEIYRHGKSQAACTIWRDHERRTGGGLAFLEQITQGGSSWNECLSVVDDGNQLLLSPMMGMQGFGGFGRQNESGGLSLQGAAEVYWGRLIQRVQR